MRTKLFFCMVCLVAVSTSVRAGDKYVKGNGKIVSKEISIADYDKISISGAMDFEYEQSDKAPYLKITTDENILPLIEITVEGNTLRIRPKGYERSNWSNTNINPTQCKVKSNSRALKELSTVGSGDIIIASALDGERLEVSMAGSGDLKAGKRLTLNTLKVSLAGSGDVALQDVKVEKMECSLAGSGDITLKGEVSRASYSLAGSGEVNAFGCKAKKVECSVAGSGEVEVYASETLEASVVSSGEIRYKGNATVSKSVMGSGSIEKVN